MLSLSAAQYAPVSQGAAAGARRLFSADGRTSALGRGDLSTHLLASMNLEIVSEHPLRGRSLLCEDAKGWVGHSEVPASRIRSMQPLEIGPREADLCIWLIEKGQLSIEQNSGIQARFGPGSVLLCDLAQPLRGHCERSRFGYIRLSRQTLLQVLGHAPAPRLRAVETLEHLGLAPFLASQLESLATHGAALNAPDLETVLGSIFRTSENVLRSVLAAGAENRAGPAADRLQAVRRHIQRNLHRHDLSVADIAHGTSISRAQLYRLFASQEKSVHATLREERLTKSMSYLKQPESDRLSIGAIAYACGFSDQAVFSKLFRQRFDMTPREARAGAAALAALAALAVNQ